jgi:DNA-directed RNA polymerase sigma subunit (sigma70/sigma32)
MRDEKTIEKTVERELTREEIAAALTRVRLSSEEELVLRMRFGIGVPDGTKLVYRDCASEETRVRLALIEKRNLEILEEGADPENTSIDRLSDF